MLWIDPETNVKEKTRIDMLRFEVMVLFKIIVNIKHVPIVIAENKKIIIKYSNT